MNERPTDYLIEKALAHLHEKEYGAANHYLDQAIGLDANNEDALGWKVSVLRLSGEEKEAEEWIKVGLNRVGDSPRLYYERGMLRFDQKRHADAMKDFDQVLRLDASQQTSYGAHAFEWKIVAESDWRRLQRRFGRAEALLEEALKGDFANSPHIWNQRGLVHYDQNRHEPAITAFENALKCDNSNQFALLWKLIAQASRLRLQRRFEEAASLLDQNDPRIEGGSYTSRILIERGLLHLEREEFAEAATRLEEALQFAPTVDCSRLRLNQVEMFIRMGKEDEALDLLHKLKRAHPGDLFIREKLGWFYIWRHRLDDAEGEFKHLLENDADDIGGVVGLGAVNLQRREYDYARERFQQAVKEAPNYALFRSKLSWALVGEEQGADLDEAESHCSRAIELDRYLAQAWGCKGLIALKRGRIRDAEENLRRSINVNPRDGSYVQLGSLYRHMGLYEEAEETLRSALKINNRDVQALVELGKVRLESDHTSQGIADLRRATKLDPRDESAGEALAMALVEQGRLDAAEHVLRYTLHRLDKARSGRLHLVLSHVLILRGDETKEDDYYKDALTEVNIALGIRPGDLDVRFQRAVLWAKLEDYRDALKDFKHILDTEAKLLKGGEVEREGVDPVRHAEAERQAKKIREQLQRENLRTKGVRSGAFVIAVISVGQLAYLWYLYAHARVSDTLLTLLIPILLGLVVVSFLLPVLVRLKLPGMEAELSPLGEIGSSEPPVKADFASPLPTVISGSR
ncbi:MAG: tetratricopeptide repeat protein [Actinomycetota bacterium]|nr:tetratricopeptide repeat protein [Actinomycetota bacterium]